MNVVLGIALAYLLASLVIGMLPGRKVSGGAEGWVAGDRALGPLVMYFITGATIFSAFAFLGMPGWAYGRGVAALYVLAFGTLGFIPFYFLGPRAARVGKRYGFVTQAEMIAARFGRPGIAIVMALITTLALVPYLAIQMGGAGMVLAEMTDGRVPRWAGAALVYGIVLVYVLRSGVLGVGWTNTFQGLFMMVLAWVLGLLVPHMLYGGVGPMFERLAAERPELLAAPGLTSAGEPWGWGEYTGTVVVSMIGFCCWPQLFMKAFSARDEATIRRTVVLYPTFQVFLVPILFLGFSGVLFESVPESNDRIVPHLLLNLELSPILVGLFCAGALAASMSSGDAIAHAAASVLVRDGWATGLGRRLSPGAERTWTRIVLVAVMLAAYTVAILYEGSLVGLLIYAYGPITQFAPALVATLYWRRARGGALLAGMVVGIVVTSVLSRWPDLRPFALHAGLWGLAGNTAVLVLGSLLGRGRPAGESEFLAVAAARPGDAEPVGRAARRS